MNAKLVKYRDTIYQNFTLETVDENGQKVYPVVNLENADEVKDAVVETLNYLTDQYFYGIAQEKGDYKNMGEIYVDAQSNDPDAQYLLKLYNAVWDAEEQAENEIDQLSDLNQLLKILQDVPGYLLPKLEEAKQKLDASLSSQTSTSTTSTTSTTGAQQ